MKFDHKVYFDSVRTDLFDGMLTQEQVDGQTVILAVWEHGEPKQDDVRKLAYMLATTFHETAQRCWPITEYGSQDYLENKKYWPYIGRGFVQLTWDYNYEKASQELGLIDKRYLIDYPDLALDSLIATRILFKGMAQGWFTGKELGDYFNDDRDDPVNARQVINGNDCDDQIAGYHDKFLAALQAARLDDAGV